MADQLSLVARRPGEFLTRLAADRRRATIARPDLHAGSDPDRLAGLVLALDALNHVRLVVETRSGTAVHRQLTCSGAALMDLDDPAALCVRPIPGWSPPLSTRTGRSAEGLHSAWLRAGQSLCRDQRPAERALVLLTTLRDAADPRLRPELAQLAATADGPSKMTNRSGTSPSKKSSTASGRKARRLSRRRERDAFHTAPQPLAWVHRAGRPFDRLGDSQADVRQSYAHSRGQLLRRLGRRARHAGRDAAGAGAW